MVSDVRVHKAEVDSLNERSLADLAEATTRPPAPDDERRKVQRLVEQLQTTLDKVDTLARRLPEAERRTGPSVAAGRLVRLHVRVGTVQSWLQAGPRTVRGGEGLPSRLGLAQLGGPLPVGRTGPAPFDCSGLTSSAYRAAGVTIPGCRGPSGGRPARSRGGQPAPRGPRSSTPTTPATRPPSPRRHVHRQRPDGTLPPTPATWSGRSIWRESFAGHPDRPGRPRACPGAADRAPPTSPTTAAPPMTTRRRPPSRRRRRRRPAADLDHPARLADTTTASRPPRRRRPPQTAPPTTVPRRRPQTTSRRPRRQRSRPPPRTSPPPRAPHDTD